MKDKPYDAINLLLVTANSKRRWIAMNGKRFAENINWGMLITKFNFQQVVPCIAIAIVIADSFSISKIS